jgi:hypothetical protein
MVPSPLHTGVGEVEVDDVVFEDVELVVKVVVGGVEVSGDEELEVEPEEVDEIEIVPVPVDVLSGSEVMVIVVTVVDELCDMVMVNAVLHEAVEVAVSVRVKVSVLVNV